MDLKTDSGKGEYRQDEHFVFQRNSLNLQQSVRGGTNTGSSIPSPWTPAAN